MKFKDIEKELKQDASFSAPKTELKKFEINLIPQKTAKRKFNFKAIVASVCVLICMSFGIGVFAYQSMLSNSETFIELNVNPAMEIEINGKGQVIEIYPLNSDAQAVCKDLNVEKLSIEVAFDKIITKMIDLGFIADNANVNVNANGKNEKLNNKMLQKAKGQIEKSLANNGKNCNISSGNNGHGANSPVKNDLIEKIMSYTDEYNKNELLKYSVKELRDLLKKYE